MTLIYLEDLPNSFLAYSIYQNNHGAFQMFCKKRGFRAEMKPVPRRMIST